MLTFNFFNYFWWKQKQWCTTVRRCTKLKFILQHFHGTGVSLTKPVILNGLGSTQGNLRLFQYPCTTARAEFVEEKSASTAVVAIRFLFEDMYVITAGGTDATLLRWKIVWFLKKSARIHQIISLDFNQNIGQNTRPQQLSLLFGSSLKICMSLLQGVQMQLYSDGKLYEIIT